MSERTERVLNLLLSEFKVAHAAGNSHDMRTAGQAIWNVLNGVCRSGNAVRVRQDNGRAPTLRVVAPPPEDDHPISSLVYCAWPTFSPAHSETVSLAAIAEFEVVPSGSSV